MLPPRRRGLSSSGSLSHRSQLGLEVIGRRTRLSRPRVGRADRRTDPRLPNASGDVAKADRLEPRDHVGGDDSLGSTGRGGPRPVPERSFTGIPRE